MVEQGDLHEELGQGPGLDVVVVGLADPSQPRVRRAVGRDVEVEVLLARPRQVRARTGEAMCLPSR